MNWECLYKGFVKTNGKKCVEKFKDVPLRTFDEVKDLDSYAGVLKDDVILIDIDDLDQSEILMDIVEDFQLDCIVRQTERGRHFLFKNSGVERCGTHKQLGLGLIGDIKSGKKASYEVIKIDGKERFLEWDSDKLDQLPKWLHPVKSKVDFFNMEEGEGRNQALFNYILTLTNSGFTKDESKECINLINKYILAEALSEDEIETITRDEAFPEAVFYDGKKFLFHEFAKYLKNNDCIYKIEGQLHIYQDGMYVSGQERIEAKMIEYIPTLRANQRTEVFKYLELVCEEKEACDARYIAFENGVYDLVENELLPFSKDLIVVNKIPWDYEEGAYSEIADNTLNKIACQDKQIRALLEEAIGYSFYRRNELSKAFFLTGDGANGKSTFLDMIKRLLSKNNFSSLDLAEMEERFSIATMFGKLANIGDDISDDFLQGRAVSVFKKVVSGNQVKAEYKGSKVFFYDPYTKLYFSANSLPRTKSKGFNAIKRRLVIIPFNARFTKNDPDFDAMITWKLRDESVMKYLVQLGIQGLRRVLENQAFTTSEKVEKELHDYEISNNPILVWLEENPVDTIVNNSTSEIYKRYKGFCVTNGFADLTQISFTKEINKRLNLETKRQRVKKELVSVFVEKN